MAELLAIQFKVSPRANWRNIQERRFLQQPSMARQKNYCSKCNWFEALPSFPNHTSPGFQSFNDAILEPENYKQGLQYDKGGVPVSLG